MTAMELVFVYGTLKAGEPNHHWLKNPNNGQTRFLGSASTNEKYPLIIGTQYNIPFLLYAPGDGNIVQGEVYEVDEDMLIKLDELEDHPNFYVRERNTVAMKDVDSEEIVNLDCWIYFLKTFKPELLEKSRYSCYSSTGEHNLPYLESNNESTIDDLDN